MRIIITARMTGLVLLACSGIAQGAAEGSGSSRPAQVAATSYEVTVPPQWRPYLKVGRVTLKSAPIYAVRPVREKGLAVACMCGVPLQWSLENLSSEPLYVEVNFRATMPTNPLANTGHSIAYELAPRERRQVQPLVTVSSATVPVVLSIRMEELRVGNRTVVAGKFTGLKTPPLPVSHFTVQPIVKMAAGAVEIKSARLTSAPALELKLANVTAKRARICIVAGIGDPVLVDWAGFKEDTVREFPLVTQVRAEFRAREERILQLPLEIPPDHAKPLLAYTVFALDETWTPNNDKLDQGKVTLIYRGSFDLAKAARKGLIKLPPRVPVQERANLTEQRKSKHFIFRYRPDSYAAGHIEQAIRDRENAYEVLSKALQMDLPEVVTIDLYPDMKAKGFGSKTFSTPANTVNNKHIAEVYSQQYQCDSGHELAHIFSYRFGQIGQNGLVEDFAVYFEQQHSDRSAFHASAKAALKAGTLKPMRQTLLQTDVLSENLSIIDFLIQKDLAKFKRFYVQVTQASSIKDLESASSSVYGMNLSELERAWRASIMLQAKTGPSGASAR